MARPVTEIDESRPFPKKLADVDARRRANPSTEELGAALADAVSKGWTPTELYTRLGISKAFFYKALDAAKQ